MKAPRLGEALFGLSYLVLAAYFLKLGRKIVFDRDLLHVAIALHWIGAWLGGARFGGRAALGWVERFGRSNQALFTAFTAWIAFGAWVSITRHQGIHPDGDFSIYAQVIHSLSRGEGYWTSLAMAGGATRTFLADHQSYALALLAPAFWTPWGVQLLFIAQAAAFYLPGLALARFYRRKHESPLLGGLIAIAWLLFIGSMRNLLWEFHETTLSVPLLALWAWALLERRAAVLIAASLACGLVKEQFLVLTAPGLLYFAWLERRRLPVALGALAAIGLQGALFVLNKRAFSGVDFIGLRYPRFGSSFDEVVSNMILRPDIVLMSLMEKMKIDFLLTLLLSSGLGALRAGWATIAWLPFFLLHALSGHHPQYSTHYHYILEIWAVLSVVAIAGLARRAARQGAWAAVALSAILWTSNPNELVWSAAQAAAESRGCAQVRTALRERIERDWATCDSGDRVVIAGAEVFPQVADLGRAYRFPDGNGLDEFAPARCRAVVHTRAEEPAARSYLAGLSLRETLTGCRDLEIQVHTTGGGS
jgi:uncharacterized membrane protein